MQEVVIISGCRTPIGSFGGALKDIPAVDLGAHVICNVLKKAKCRPVFETHKKDTYDYEDKYLPLTIDEVIMGSVLQAGQGQNPARQAAVKAGLSFYTPACTVNKVCGSGLKAVTMGAQAIMTGQAEIVIAGGQENMSSAPYALSQTRWGKKMEVTGEGRIKDLLVYDGLYDKFYGCHMGVTAENLAQLYYITRQEQDEAAFQSYMRSFQANMNGAFTDEIVPIKLNKHKPTDPDYLYGDEGIDWPSMDLLSGLMPAFKENGTVTAGNASTINDGAAAVLLMSKTKAQELGLEPKATIKSFASVGTDPAYMGIGPVPAIGKALALAKMNLNDVEMVEINEAFASQIIACTRELGIPMDLVNELGSGISLGHPIGCTGARQLVTLIHHMNHVDYTTGLVSMCIGGGMGMAMLVERRF